MGIRRKGIPDWRVDFCTPSGGIAVRAILKEIGASGVKARIIRHNDCARLVADRARRTDGPELVVEPDLSNVCIRYVAEGMNGEDLDERILEELRRQYDHVPSATQIHGQFAIRACLINPRSGLDDVLTK